jgi:hypothetical protein
LDQFKSLGKTALEKCVDEMNNNFQSFEKLGGEIKDCNAKKADLVQDIKVLQDQKGHEQAGAEE